MWTLDRLFLQPRSRLKYYKKLYARLLKSTKPGRSDHSLLLSATETLDRLFHRVETRLGVSVTVSEHGPQPTGDSVEAQLQQLEQELSPPPPIASKSERRDSHGSSQWGSGTTFVSSKSEQPCVLTCFQGSEIIKGHGPHLSWSESSINAIEDAGGRTRTTTINGACFRYLHDATEGQYRHLFKRQAPH